MKNQVKVKQTKIYKDSQGEHIVCKGKLVLIYHEKQIGSFIYNSKWCSPIIISETEEVKQDDWCLLNNKQYINQIWHNKHGVIGSVTGSKEYIANHTKKILTLPENFSPKHLQAIIDGKLKNGDDVYIECEKWQAAPHKNDLKKEDWNEVKLNSNNHIKLFPINKEESWDDIKERSIREKIATYSDYSITISNELFNFLKANYLPPKRK